MKVKGPRTHCPCIQPADPKATNRNEINHNNAGISPQNAEHRDQTSVFVVSLHLNSRRWHFVLFFLFFSVWRSQLAILITIKTIVVSHRSPWPRPRKKYFRCVPMCAWTFSRAPRNSIESRLSMEKDKIKKTHFFFVVVVAARRALAWLLPPSSGFAVACASRDTQFTYLLPFIQFEWSTSPCVPVCMRARIDIVSHVCIARSIRAIFEAKNRFQSETNRVIIGPFSGEKYR